MTRTQHKWRANIHRAAETFAEQLSETHSRPAEEETPTLNLAIQSMVQSLSDNGFSRQEIEDGLVAGGAGASELIDEESWQQGVDGARAHQEVSGTWHGKLLERLAAAGGISILLGLMMMAVTVVVSVSGGPAAFAAWSSLALFVAGIAVVATSGSILNHFVRRRSRQMRRAREGGGR